MCVRIARSRRSANGSVYAVVKVSYRLRDLWLGPDAVTDGIAAVEPRGSVPGDSASLDLRRWRRLSSSTVPYLDRRQPPVLTLLPLPQKSITLVYGHVDS